MKYRYRNLVIKSLVISLLSCLLSCGQQRKEKEEMEKAKGHLLSASDELHWKGEKYLVNRSFLSIFLGPDYFQVYPMVPLACVDYVYGTAAGYSDKNFSPIWLVVDNTLYLRDIDFIMGRSSVENELPNGQLYRIMENLTGRKFIPDNPSLKAESPPSCRFGSIRADWVTGVFYVKKIRRWQHNEESIEAWEAAPFQKLTFKAGKLISVKSVKP